MWPFGKGKRAPREIAQARRVDQVLELGREVERDRQAALDEYHKLGLRLSGWGGQERRRDARPRTPDRRGGHA